jgi:hypothetical protein
MGKVLDIYKAMAKREVNFTLAQYGELPGFLLKDLAQIRLNTFKMGLMFWESMVNLPLEAQEMKDLVREEIHRHKGMIDAFGVLIEELGQGYDNELPYKQI